MTKFLEAFSYFLSNGLDFKLAKELAESVTGTKVPDEKTLEAFTPELKKSAGTAPKKLATKKVRGDLTFVNTKISNPMKSDFVLRGLDGTSENLYNKFRQEQEAIKNGMLKDLNFIKQNNIALTSKDKDNLLYNIKIYNELTNKVNKTADELVDAGKEPEKIYTSYKNNILNKKKITPQDLKEMLIGKDGTIEDMEKAMDILDEITKKAKLRPDRPNILKTADEIKQGKLKFQGKGYGDDSSLYRTLARQFLRDEIEAGRIETSQEIYNAMKTGAHPRIDAIKIFRHHYGDDAFDILGKYIDFNYPQFDANLPALKYPGRFEFRKLGLTPKNKKAPGNTYEHYSLPGEIDQEIKEIDAVIKDIEAGNSPFYKNRDEIVRGIMEQNNRRANLVKVKNDLVPEDTKVLPGDEVFESADVVPIKKEGIETLDLAKELEELTNKNLKERGLGDIKLGDKLPKSKKKKSDVDEDVVPIKQEGIISDVDLNVDRTKKTFNNVELYGDEDFNELQYIEKYGVHPRDLDPEEGFAKGGIVSLT